MREEKRKEKGTYRKENRNEGGGYANKKNGRKKGQTCEFRVEA